MSSMGALFHEYPKDKFPIRIMMFSPGGDLVFDTGEVQGFAAVPVEGLGPGSVRYSLTLFGDGTADFTDDPTCSGTVSYTRDDSEVLGRLMYMLEIVQDAGRTFIEDGSAIASSIEEPNQLRDYFEKQVQIGELMLHGVEVTRNMLEESTSQGE